MRSTEGARVADAGPEVRGELPRRPQVAAAAAAGALLLAVYMMTLAPGVTFWDAGELVAAIDTFGIPHPPGTPIYIAIGRAWRELLGMLPAALASNALSAVCTAGACALAVDMLARRTGRAGAAAGAGITAGAMSSVWLNATETEVYSVALLLSAAMLWAASGAERTGDARWTALVAYLIALAAPLHASAMLAAPAAVVLAGSARQSTPRIRTRIALVGAVLAAGGVATGRWSVAIAGAVILGALATTGSRPGWRTLGMVALGVSPLLIMLLRAQHDPPINQGNPSTLGALADVVSRRQYLMSGPWPRQAPVWIQAGNMLQYSDWQVALGLAPQAPLRALRSVPTLLFVALAVLGARAHARRDRIGHRAMLVLLASATIGVMLYLNLKAGPSIGWGILSADAPHEARERDYFFALGFWTWGLWAGYGAVTLFERTRVRHAGLTLAALPLVLNWRAVDRRREPDASAPRLLAESLLESTPRQGTLFVWGDNDTYPLWHAQQSEQRRRDVLIVTIPLLSARWYRAELARRDSLSPGAWQGETRTVAEVASLARRAGRPVAFAATVPALVRTAAGASWRLCGNVWVEPSVECRPIDARPIALWLHRHPVSTYTGPTTIGMLDALRCAARQRSDARVTVAPDSLDSVCNAR